MFIKECRVCSQAGNFELIIDLGMQPWGNNFLKLDEIGHEPFYPLQLVYCNECSTAQLNYTVPKNTMFSKHTYVSGTTTSLQTHFKNTAKAILDSHFKLINFSPNVLDIGSNDGTQLKIYQDLGCQVLGVESASNLAEIANRNNLKTINSFFNLELAKSLETKFDIINASGIFFHLEELHSVSEGIKYLLKENGIFLIQFIYMKDMQKNVAFDQIYHEHLLYYNLETLDRLLNIHGLELFDAYQVSIHGGSIISYASHVGTREKSANLQFLKSQEEMLGSNSLESYKEFAEKALESKFNTLNWLENCKKDNKTLMGLGAPVKGNTLLNYYGITKDDLSGLLERNELRRNLYAPGSHIPIVLEDELQVKPDAYLVLAWNFRDEILKRHQPDVKNGIDFYFPVKMP
jgi:SAM-dependent methyltransferase